MNYDAGRPGARLIRGYYGATLVFVLLDYLLDVNVRLAFLDAWPAWRALYYVACLGLFALMLWRPRFSAALAAAESLLGLSFLIIGMGSRVLIVTDEMIEAGRGFVTVRELVNFALAGTIAYVALLRELSALRAEMSGSGHDQS